MAIKKFFKRFIQEEEGATAVEYAVMVVLIIVACIATIAILSDAIENAFQVIADTLNDRTP